MKVIDKMNELVGSHASKEKIMGWAYQNRVHVICMHLDEPKFESLESTVQKFVDSGQLVKDMRKKYRAIAEKNGIKYTTFMTRLEAGYPMDVSATYTQEALRKWRERNDKQNSISGKTDQGS